LEPSKTYLHQIRVRTPELNSAIFNLYQIGPVSNKGTAINILLGDIFKEPVYSVLRTKEQLGYVVWSGARINRGVLEFKFYVQSGTHDPDTLDARIEAFIKENRVLEDMEDEHFEKYRKALIMKQKEKPRSLNNEASQFLTEIKSHQYLFDRSKRMLFFFLVHSFFFLVGEVMVSELEKLKKQDVVDWFNKYIRNPDTRAKLSVRMYAQDKEIPKVDGVVNIGDDYEKFKNQMELFPVLCCF